MSDQNTPPSGGGNVYAAPEARVDDVLPEGELELAGRGTRLGAAIIDGILIAVLNGAFGFVIGYNMLRPDPSTSIMMYGAMFVSGIAFYLIINGYLLAQNGQTIAKKLLGIKIVRTDGSKADLQRIIGLRLLPVWIAQAIPFVNIVVGLVDALLIFRENHKCLHDNIADTIVIKA